MTYAGCGLKMRAQTMGPAQTLTYRCTSKESKQWVCPHLAGHVKEQVLAEQFAGIVARLKLPEDWLARLDELVNVGDGAVDSEGKRRALKERLARLKKKYEWNDIGEEEYVAKRNAIKRELAGFEPSASAAIVDAACYL